MSLWDEVRNAVGHFAHQVGSEIEQGVHAAAAWTRNLISPQGGAVAVVPIEQETPKIMAGSSQEWHTGADTAKALAGRTRGLSDRVLDVARTFESAWTGQSAQAANAHVTKIGHVLDSTSATLDANSGNVSSVASNFDYTKNSMVKLPSPPPEASFWDKAAPWDTDTENAVKKYNADAQRNLEVYKSYATATQQQGSALQSDYGELGTFDGGDITLAKDPAAPPAAHGTGGHGNTPPHQQHQQVGPPSSSAPPSGSPSASGPGAVSGGHDTNGSSFPNAGGEGTSTAGYVPPATSPGGGGGSNLSNLPFGSIPGSNTPNTVGPSPYAVGGFGYPGGGSGPGAGSGGRLPGESGPGSGGPGSGRQTGARGGGAAEETVRGGPAASGRGGGRSTSSPGGMAQGGRGGKTEEDREHERKYVLDDDGLFDEDGKTVDPVTGLPPVPPTIGA
ncbi:hypothetical protein [Amycolatopsis saalfeldensis]|uniref:PPE family protein n=1 Tax=Amycolatopsis saalfeldensis TaxID=394193 RepID=A0A1H8YJU4_9PSEU|nr:hypothetical protein [Amycolatopsis saalfeldensis]SEP52435.1 hypothetical protein SAMN04489732_12098 [Amycolatopsis saalfeldensis]